MKLRKLILALGIGLVITFATVFIKTTATGQGCGQAGRSLSPCIILESSQSGWPIPYAGISLSIQDLNLTGPGPIAFVEDWLIWSAAGWIAVVVAAKHLL